MVPLLRERGIRSKLTPQRAVLVGVRGMRMSMSRMQHSLDELASLVDTAGGIVVGLTSQEVKRIDSSTYLGRGKVDEIAHLVEEGAADLVVVDAELSPVQNRNLEDRVGALVLDRSAVILDIFAKRARSSEGKLQVELAQLQYLAPRLVGRGKIFSQQAGRIGTRGPGETALEYDRRRIRERITLLRRSLERVRAHRDLHRRKRASVPIPMISLVGYTNAGKSTLMNSLTDASVFVEDKLFATLDPTVRRLRLPSGREVLLADTVGFISRLPHELIEAFKSTFEEVASSQLLLHVIDGSDEEASVKIKVVENVLEELDLSGKSRVDVINKSDIAGPIYNGDADSVKVSALTGEGMEKILEKLDTMLLTEFVHVSLLMPHERGDIVSDLYKVAHVNSVSYNDDGIRVECELHAKQYGKYRKYVEHRNMK
ncbi:MAG: GTPase HflX [Pseudomonadota bacterium]